MCSAVWASFAVRLYVGGATPTAGIPTAPASLLGKLIFSANSCKLQFPHRNRCTNVVCVSNAVERWRGEAEGGGRGGRIAARWVVHMVTNVVGTPWCRRLCIICTMAKKTLSRKIQDRKIHTEEMHSCRYTHTYTRGISFRCTTRRQQVKMPVQYARAGGRRQGTDDGEASFNACKHKIRIQYLTCIQ